MEHAPRCDQAGPVSVLDRIIAILDAVKESGRLDIDHRARGADLHAEVHCVPARRGADRGSATWSARTKA